VAFSKKTWIGVIAVVLVVVLIVALTARREVVSKAKSETVGENLNLSIETTTTLIGKDGKPVTVPLILGFYIDQTEVVSVRILCSWNATGTGLKWDTLSVTVQITGNNGWYYTYTWVNTTASSFGIYRIFSTEELGYVPAQGEEVIWWFDIDLTGNVQDLIGRTCSASLPQPIRVEIPTVYLEADFSLSGEVTSTAVS